MAYQQDLVNVVYPGVCQAWHCPSGNGRLGKANGNTATPTHKATFGYRVQFVCTACAKTLVTYEDATLHAINVVQPRRKPGPRKRQRIAKQRVPQQRTRQRGRGVAMQPSNSLGRATRI